MRWCTGSLSRILSLSENELIYSLGGADGNRTHVLKVTELHRRGNPQILFNYIYNNGFGNWPRKCSLRPLPCWKSFAEKNHAAVLVLRHQELWACELLTNRHRRSCLCDFFPPQQPAHNILTSESLFGGVTPSLRLRSFNYLWTTLPETWECLGSKSYTDVASTTM